MDSSGRQSQQTIGHFTCSDGDLQRECKKLNYDKVIYILDHKLLPVDHVGCYEQVTSFTDSNGRCSKNFISKNFNSRYDFESKLIKLNHFLLFKLQHFSFLYDF